MKTTIILLAAVLLQTGVACAATGTPESSEVRSSGRVVCKWRAVQQSGIPVQICLSRGQWAQRVAYTQQSIRQYQARSFVTKF